MREGARRDWVAKTQTACLLLDVDLQNAAGRNGGREDRHFRDIRDKRSGSKPCTIASSSWLELSWSIGRIVRPQRQPHGLGTLARPIYVKVKQRIGLEVVTFPACLMASCRFVTWDAGGNCKRKAVGPR